MPEGDCEFRLGCVSTTHKSSLCGRGHSIVKPLSKPQLQSEQRFTSTENTPTRNSKRSRTTIWETSSRIRDGWSCEKACISVGGRGRGRGCPRGDL